MVTGPQIVHTITLYSKSCFFSIYKTNTHLIICYFIVYCCWVNISHIKQSVKNPAILQAYCISWRWYYTLCMAWHFSFIRHKDKILCVFMDYPCQYLNMAYHVQCWKKSMTTLEVNVMWQSTTWTLLNNHHTARNWFQTPS